MVETFADNTVQTRIPRQLRESDVHGKGAAEIGWGTPGDFARCQAFMRRHDVPGREIDGACANLHKLATGEWPGKNAHKGHLATAAVITLTAAAAPPEGKRIPWEGPLAPIGVATGDRRIFPPNTLEYQSFPMPLRWQERSGRGHDGAVTVAVINGAEEKMINGKPMVWGHGFWLDPEIIPEVRKAMHQVDEGVTGPSVDLDNYTAALRPDEFGKPLATLAKGRMRAATLVPVPAFADLRIKTLYPDAVTASLDFGQFAVNSNGWQGAPIAPREALFDADDAAKRIEAWANGDPAKMAKMFLWVDTESGPLLGRKGYRLPWGDIVDEKPYLIYHAIYAAAALLQDAHGGLPNIPDDQKNKLRSVISEIYQELANEYQDPNMVAPWDRAQVQAAAPLEPLDPGREYVHYLWAFDAALEEFRYSEAKHPRDPRHDKHAGEWVDVPKHDAHGRIKVGSKWVYPPKKGEKGYKNPEAAVRAKAKRGAGSPAGKAVGKAKVRPAPKSDAGRQRHTVRHGPSTTEREREADKRRAAELRDVAGARKPAPREEPKKERAKPEPVRQEQTVPKRQPAEKQDTAAHERAVQRREEAKAKAAEGAKKVAAKKAVEKAPEGVQAAKAKVKPALNEAQERHLRNAHEGRAVHPGTKKVLQREGYLGEDGKLTDKGRKHLGVEKGQTKEPEPKKVAPKKAAAKKAAPRKAAPKKEEAKAPEAEKPDAEKERREALGGEAKANADRMAKLLGEHDKAREAKAKAPAEEKAALKTGGPEHKGVHEIRLPDGRVEKRTSKTRHYTHAVLVTRNNHRDADIIEARAKRRKESADAYEQAMESGDWSKFDRVATSFNGRGEKFYSMRYKSGNKDDNFDYPDAKKPDQVAERGAKHVAQQRRQAETEVAESKKLREGPEESYSIGRWSSSEQAARGALSAYDIGKPKNNPAYTSRVVKVGEDLSVGKPEPKKEVPEAKAPEAPRAPEGVQAAKVRKAAAPKEHKPTPAQQKVLEGIRGDSKGRVDGLNPNNPSVKKLESEGFIEKVPGAAKMGDRTQYRLTDKGRKHLGVEGREDRVAVRKATPAAVKKAVKAAAPAKKSVPGNKERQRQAADRLEAHEDLARKVREEAMAERAMPGLQKERKDDLDAKIFAAQLDLERIAAQKKGFKDPTGPLDPSVKSKKAKRKNHWGENVTPGGIQYHPDGEIGAAVGALGADADIDVDGERLDNFLGRIATDTVHGTVSPEDQVARLRALGERFPEGSKPRRVILNAADEIDAPPRERPASYEGAPRALQDLMDDLLAIPLARGGSGADQRDADQGEVGKLDKILKEWHAEKLSPIRLQGEIRQLEAHHESQEGYFAIRYAVQRALRRMSHEDRWELLPPGQRPARRAATPVKKAAPAPSAPRGINAPKGRWSDLEREAAREAQERIAGLDEDGLERQAKNVRDELKDLRDDERAAERFLAAIKKHDWPNRTDQEQALEATRQRIAVKEADLKAMEDRLDAMAKEKPKPKELSEDAKSLGKKYSSGKRKSTQAVDAGAQGHKEIITFEDGSKVFVKKLTKKGLFDGHDGKAEADSEELASLLGRAIGAPVPAVHREGDRHIVMDFVDGETQAKLGWGAGKDDPEGLIRLGLLDMLIANGDRHAGNIMIDQDGKYVGIDHGLGWSILGGNPKFATDDVIKAQLQHLMGPGEVWGRLDNPLAAGEADELRKKLEALRPQFRERGRENWLDYSLKMLDRLDERSAARRRRIKT